METPERLVKPVQSSIKTPKLRHFHRSNVFIFDFEHISHTSLVFPLLTLKIEITAGIFPLKINLLNQVRGNIK